MMTITGIMRSATSLAAVTANQSGILMGSSMVIPYGGLTEEWSGGGSYSHRGILT